MWDGSEWVGLAGGAGLYDFINVTFSSGVTGAIGPTISQARNAMSGQGVNLWNTNSLYFNVDSNGVQSWTVPKSGVYSQVSLLEQKVVKVTLLTLADHQVMAL